jgi:hypothetical protein
MQPTIGAERLCLNCKMQFAPLAADRQAVRRRDTQARFDFKLVNHKPEVLMSKEEAAVDRSAIEHLFGLMSGYFASRAIHVAAELGIADYLRDGPKTLISLRARPRRIVNRSIDSYECWRVMAYLQRISTASSN